MNSGLLAGPRSGNRNEVLGISLLQSIGAVAPVPRGEDVGLDAIVTLLRQEGRMLAPENCFGVQIKSANDANVVCSKRATRWLERLEVPFLVGAVERSQSSISLYPGHKLSPHFIQQKKAKRVRLILKPSRRRLRGIAGVADVVLGEPLLIWRTHETLGQKEYDIMKAYLDAELRNIKFRPLGYCELIDWKTGEMPVCGCGTQESHLLKSDDALMTAFDYLMPPLRLLASRAFGGGDSAALPLVKKVLKYMREHQFDPDPDGRLTMTQPEFWDYVLRGKKKRRR